MVGCESCRARIQCAENEIDVYQHQLRCVDSFTYPGSVISRNKSAQKDFKNILSKARNAFACLIPAKAFVLSLNKNFCLSSFFQSCKDGVWFVYSPVVWMIDTS